MRNIFELTKSQQRIVILVVTLLVAIAFARHALRLNAQPLLKTSEPEATHSTQDQEKQSPNDSRD
jgi:hypothetical protein